MANQDTASDRSKQISRASNPPGNREIHALDSPPTSATDPLWPPAGGPAISGQGARETRGIAGAAELLPRAGTMFALTSTGGV